jgi:hypothetical protein
MSLILATLRCRYQSYAPETGLEEVLSEMRVSIRAMAGLAENFVATARLLGQSMERLEKEIKKRK